MNIFKLQFKYIKESVNNTTRIRTYNHDDHHWMQDIMIICYNK